MEQAPKVRHNAITWFFTTEPLGTSKEYIGYQGFKDFYFLDQSSIHVTLNPTVLPYIDKYEVSAKFLEVRKTAHKPSKTAQAPIMVDGVGQGSVSYCPISFDSEFFFRPRLAVGQILRFEFVHNRLCTSHSLWAESITKRAVSSAGQADSNNIYFIA